jgi:hypothetical protein
MSGGAELIHPALSCGDIDVNSFITNTGQKA